MENKQKGKGHSIITANTREKLYSLVIFKHIISNGDRSDRVIANKWDLTFTLFRGIPNEKEFKHLKNKCSSSRERYSYKKTNYTK